MPYNETDISRKTITKIVNIIEAWASPLDDIDSVMLGGSYAAMVESSAIPSGSDVDLIIYLRLNSDNAAILKSLALLSLSSSLYFHPVIMEREDLSIKHAISEYRAMIRAARLIFNRNGQLSF